MKERETETHTKCKMHFCKDAQSEISVSHVLPSNKQVTVLRGAILGAHARQLFFSSFRTAQPAIPADATFFAFELGPRLGLNQDLVCAAASAGVNVLVE